MYTKISIEKLNETIKLRNYYRDEARFWKSLAKFFAGVSVALFAGMMVMLWI